MESKSQTNIRKINSIEELMEFPKNTLVDLREITLVVKMAGEIRKIILSQNRIRGELIPDNLSPYKIYVRGKKYPGKEFIAAPELGVKASARIDMDTFPVRDLYFVSHPEGLGDKIRKVFYKQ